MDEHDGYDRRLAGTLTLVLVLARFVLVMSLLLSLVALSAPKKKKPVPKSAANVATELEIKKTLDGAEAKVGACVLDNMPGAFTLVVKAQLMLNSAGQLLGSTVTLAAEGAGAAKARVCIDGVLKTLTWPRSTGPIVNAEREWTFKTE